MPGVTRDVEWSDTCGSVAVASYGHRVAGDAVAAWAPGDVSGVAVTVAIAVVIAVPASGGCWTCACSGELDRCLEMECIETGHGM